MVKHGSPEKVEFGQRLAEGEGMWVCRKGLLAKAEILRSTF